ncbi:ParB/RepB/Spo0J family partition protein [Nocardioides kongjuensis]|uniref:ParB/RepB/Spo0J family partition protein n=1 Tax=Nocardioides kongjuensis TaxID=349522 RepID=UPI0015CD1E35
MNAQAPRRGLGRGLGSLIPTAPPTPVPAPAGGEDVNPGAQNSDFATGASSSAPVAPGSTGSTNGAQNADSVLQPVDGAYFAELPVEQISPNAVNPRTVFDEEAMAELVHSIKEIGLLQPVVVRKTGTDSYELVMGERRWRATQAAGLGTIPAIVRETDDTDMLRDALLENLHRSNLNPLEEAAAYQQLLEDFSCTHDELAQRIGRSRPQISNTLRLLKLSPAVQRRVAAGVLSAGHARALLGVGDSEQQDRLAQRVIAEGISVRGLEEIVAVGDGTTGTPPRPRRAKPQAPGLGELSERLGDRLETRVKIDLGKAKGKISIEFANTGDLQRIVDLIDPRNRNDRPI